MIPLTKRDTPDALAAELLKEAKTLTVDNVLCHVLLGTNLGFRSQEGETLLTGLLKALDEEFDADPYIVVQVC